MENEKKAKVVEVDFPGDKARCPRANGGNAECLELNCRKNMVRVVLGERFNQATDDEIAEIWAGLVNRGIDTCHASLQLDLCANVRYLFDSEYGYGYTEGEIAKQMEVRPERIRQFIEKALRQLRNPAKSGRLKEFC